MGKSEPGHTSIKMKVVGNVQRRANKGSNMPVLVKFLKGCHLLRLLHFTVIMSNIRKQSFFSYLPIRCSIYFFCTFSGRYRDVSIPRRHRT